MTTNYNKMSRTNPRVFTEQGVAMLATILKSKVAIQVSIAIMDAFVAMKKYISTNLIEDTSTIEFFKISNKMSQYYHPIKYNSINFIFKFFQIIFVNNIIHFLT